MNEQRGTLETFARHFVAALEPLRRAVSDENSFRSLMLRLGWETAGLPPAYMSMGNAIADAAQAIKALSDDPKPAEIADLLVKTKTAYEKIRGIDTAPPGVNAGAFLAEIGERLFEILLTEYLATEQTAIFNLLSTLNVIEVENIEPTAQQRGYVRTHFKWEEIPKIIQDPASLPERVYGWGTPDLRFHLVVQHVGEMLSALGFPVFTGPADDLLADAYHDADTGVDETAWLLKVPFYYITIANKNLEAAFTMMELKGENGRLPGVIIQPEIPEEFPLKFHIAPTIDLRLLAGTNAASQFGMLLRPGEASIKYPFQPGQAPPAAGIGIGFDFTPATPTLLFGAPGATRLEFQGGSADFGAKSNQGTLDILLSAQLKGLALVLAGGESDSFLRSLIGDGESRIEIPLGIEWSRSDGVHFSGSSAFEATLHPGLRLGPLALEEIALRLFVPPDRSADLALSASVGLSGELGPVAFVIDKIGFQIETRFTPGNLGPLDLQPGFKPPNGVGLAIDAEVVHGGGFLSFDTANGQYSGAMFLEFEGGLAVTALGLITTRLPDGAKGYSLMVIITAEGFAPIQLGYGFTLTGIGGLLAINRTFDEAALRAGLKNHTLDSVMFPKDPIRNAPQILSNLNKVFPPANGHHLFGPMVQISWGTPVLITADLGVVLEFGARLRLLILAQIVAILPNRQNDLMRLQMDAVGVLDFDQGTAALDATLYDSRLLQKFVLTGDMAMRMNWEGSPNFALAIGGLHPAFNPPPNFPKLARIAINLSAGDNPRVRCEAYFALTANTVQFGARLELYASASGFSIQGETGFDVLIQLDPFYFLADFYAQVQLKRGSTNLFKVRVEGALAGPRPLHIKGKATFEVLWWDVSIRIDRTLVEGEKPPAPQPIDVLPRLKEALSNAGNWVGNLPDGQRKMVTLRATPAAPTDVLLHPLGTLTVRQSVVPLDIDISRFGQAAPAGARRFTISKVNLGGQNETTQSVKDFFAPAQFFEMSDDEKLSRPSFESMNAGIGFGSDEIDFTANADDWLEVESIEFETITVDKEKDESRSSGPKDLYVLSPELLGKQARFGAAGASDIRRTGRAKYRTTVGKYQIAKEGWSVVATDDLTAQGEPTIYSQAEQALQKLKQDDPAKAARLTILRLSELL